jgi:hypothetical protein
VITRGKPPFLECSSKGDGRFSAFNARLEKYEGKSIEQLYQAKKVFEDGSTGLKWREAKGRKPVNGDECRAFYSQLWDEYIEENPYLLRVLREASGLSDVFGQVGHACQAIELWRIRNG